MKTQKKARNTLIGVATFSTTVLLGFAVIALGAALLSGSGAL